MIERCSTRAIPPPAEPWSQSIEAEAAQDTQNADVSTEFTGYSGTGFRDYVGEGYIRWSVDIPKGTTYRLDIRYSLERASNVSRPLAVEVDGAQQTVLPFNGTSTWTNWKQESTYVTLGAGTHTLTLTTQGESGPMIDSITLIEQF